MLYQSIENTYLFQSISQLEKAGYVIPKDNPKIFISYAHADKGIVKPFVEKLKDIGIHVWFDEVEIDFGDNITEKIQKGIKDCEVAILMLSHNTKKAFYAKHELITIFNDLIYKKKKVIPIKIDDVNPNDILYGLNNYLYVDYHDVQHINLLIKELQFKFRKS